MISFLTGTVAGMGDGFALIEVHGVGYRVAMSTSSLAALPREGDEVTVHTHLHVREDEMSLFGFESVAEREAFELLISISGVGPKLALAVLSSLRPDALAEAVARDDAGLIATVPGVGKKTASRIILDLKDRLGVPDRLAGGPSAAPDAIDEARQALLSMGFTAAEIAVAVTGYEGGRDDAQALLRYALRRLGGGV
ncbi:MAG: Holliday junction branch migration protein RuvA [Coriobacteriaceae bacterium]|nr:Holliday junction branch migration protein RuvA [Coriobacteriaceae bacterium]